MSVPQAAPGPPFVLTSANDGLMVDPVTGKIILGEPNATPGTPSQFLANKDLVTKGFLFRVGDVDFSANGTQWIMDDTNRRFLFTSAVGDMLDLDQTNGQYIIGDISAAVNGTKFTVDDGAQIFTAVNNGSAYLTLDVANNYYSLGDDFNATNGGVFTIDNGAGRIQMKNLINGFISSQVFDIRGALNTYSMGDLDLKNNGLRFVLDDTIAKFQIDNIAHNSLVRINGVDGFTGTVTPVNSITVNGGIVTAVS